MNNILMPTTIGMIYYLLNNRFNVNFLLGRQRFNVNSAMEA